MIHRTGGCATRFGALNSTITPMIGSLHRQQKGFWRKKCSLCLVNQVACYMLCDNAPRHSTEQNISRNKQMCVSPARGSLQNVMQCPSTPSAIDVISSSDERIRICQFDSWQPVATRSLPRRWNAGKMPALPGDGYRL